MSWLQRLRSMFRAAPPVPQTGVSRWVVVDVETSGLDMRRDRLLAMAAIGLRVDWTHRSIDVQLGDSFEVVLRQDRASSRNNILLHGIGVQSQLAGIEMVAGLHAFVDFVGNDPLLAFHSVFDQTMIGRHCREHLGHELANPWVDIEHLCAVTHEKVKAHSLDEWMAHFGIQCPRRHQAAADTLAECDLLLRIWPELSARCNSWSDVQQLAAQRRWLLSRLH